MASLSTEWDRVREEPVESTGGPRLWTHPGWLDQFPWVLQGTTDRRTDYGLFGSRPAGEAMEAWRGLRELDGVRSTVHSRQVHEAEVVEWRSTPAGAFVLVDGFDAHVTSQPGVLLTITVADCVPVFMVVEEPRAVCLAHAGWRGTAAGVLERSLGVLTEFTGCATSDVWLHCGPSICGACYEVGPEVHRALRPGSRVPEKPEPIDLKQVLADSAIRSGLRSSRVTVSTHCTRCGNGTFHSHRAGDAGRQVGVIAVRG